MRASKKLAIASECRVRVQFDEHPPLDYRASLRAAYEFAVEAERVGARITIDDRWTDDLRPLPCHELWNSAWPSSANPPGTVIDPL